MLAVTEIATYLGNRVLESECFIGIQGDQFDACQRLRNTVRIEMVDGCVEGKAAIPFDCSECETVPVKWTRCDVRNESPDLFCRPDGAVVGRRQLDDLGIDDVPGDRSVLLCREPGEVGVVSAQESRDRTLECASIKRRLEVEGFQTKSRETESGGLVAQCGVEVFLLLM